MKTPREILLKRHETAQPKLDDIREHLVAELRGEKRDVHRSWGIDPVAVPILIWRQLVLPSRRIWAGLAATWLLLALVHLSMSGRPSTLVAAAAPTPEMVQSYWQQERLLAELIGPTEARVADKKYLPSPRSERRFEMATV